MTVNFNLVLVLKFISLQSLINAFNLSENNIRDFHQASQPKSQSRNLLLANVEIKPSNTLSKPGAIEDAKYMFDVTGLSYCSEKDIKDYKGNYSKMLSAEFKPLEVIIDKENEMQAYIASHSERKEIFVAFRGSVNNKNWEMNLKTSQVPFGNKKGVLVHNGFNTIFNAMESELLTYISPLFTFEQYKNYTIVFIGHSLGGALATLAAAKLPPIIKVPWESVKLFTFGSPRVGNREFANLINSKPIESTRIVNNDDPIPKLPFINYVHIHNEMFIKGEQTIVCKTSYFEDPECSKALSISFSNNSHNSVWGKTNVMDDC